MKSEFALSQEEEAFDHKVLHRDPSQFYFEAQELDYGRLEKNGVV